MIKTLNNVLMKREGPTGLIFERERGEFMQANY